MFCTVRPAICLLVLANFAFTDVEARERADGPLSPKDLRCEYRVDPIGVDAAAPRLSWEINDPRRGAVQTAWQVQVSKSADDCRTGKGTTWDTGKVESSQSIQVVYAGEPLESSTRYYWRVRTWDQAGQASPYSEVAFWETGLLEASDWVGAWLVAPDEATESEGQHREDLIGDAKWIWHPDAGDAHGEKQVVDFAKYFDIPEDGIIADNVMQITADESYGLYPNHRPFDWSWDGAVRINERTIYGTLHPGENKIAVRTSNTEGKGAFIFAMEVRMEDGRTVRFVSDETWTTILGGIEGGAAPKNAVVVGEYGDEPWGELPIVSPFDLLEPASMFRKTFEVGDGLTRATAYMCGLGYSELYVNGGKVGDRVLDPARTSYSEVSLYTVNDITDRLKPGKNAVGALVGEGWFGQTFSQGGRIREGKPTVVLQLLLEYQDGRREIIATDETWRAGTGPIRWNNVFYGERYDARKEIPGWATAGFDDAEWYPVNTRTPVTENLVAQYLPPIRETGTVQPVAITNPLPGVYVYDMGENFAGYARLKVDAPRGTEIRLRFAEVLDERGMLHPGTTGPNAFQTDFYVCKGGGPEVWTPRFTYHGFQYVEVTGFPGEPTLDNIEGVVVHTDLERAGRFECSDPMLNKIHEVALRTQLSNVHGMPTDCPHRERAGWLGDAHCTAETVNMNFHGAAFWTKFLRDIQTSLNAEGIPGLAAPLGRGHNGTAPDWGSAIMQLPWYLYRYYGDMRVLEGNYAHMTRWIEHLGELTENDILKLGYGDWAAPSPEGPHSRAKHETPVPLTATAYYYWDIKIMAETARALGHAEDAKKYDALAERVRDAFNRAFFDRENNTYGTQTATAMALYLNLPPEDRLADVAKSFVERVVEVDGGHCTSGIHGLRHVYRQLSRFGYGDVAVDVFKVKGYPGFDYLFSLGATTLWEQWGTHVEKDPTYKYSRNHPMHNGYDPWFYQWLGGIQPDPAHPGFKHFVLRPGVETGVKTVDTSYHSPYGRIVSNWRADRDTFIWEAVVPPNSSATAYLPGTERRSITESGNPLSESAGIEYLGTADGRTVCQLAAGQYLFNVQR